MARSALAFPFGEGAEVAHTGAEEGSQTYHTKEVGFFTQISRISIHFRNLSLLTLFRLALMGEPPSPEGKAFSLSLTNSKWKHSPQRENVATE